MTPRPRLLLLAALALPILIAGVWLPPLRHASILFNGALIVAAVADRFVSPPLNRLQVVREVSEVLSVGARNPVDLHVRNTANTHVDVDLIDEAPSRGTATELPLTLSLQSGQERTGRYHFEPFRRGRAEFTAVYLRSVSRLGLWTLIERRELPTPVRILPDIRAVYRYELMARRNRLEEMGLKLHRLRGQGSDFERLRDYRREDELRQIDWKATARHQRLISREFNVERNQNVLVAVDCGRSMLNESNSVSYLDRALNASIMLSYIALGQGDNVGFLAFSSQIERSVKPVRGKPAIQTVLQHSFDLEARRDASDYVLAIEQLTRRYRKRSLVILLTHVIDEQHLDAICQPLRAVRSPHLFLCVFLRDLGLTNLATRLPETDLDAFQTAAAAELLTAIERKTATLRERGILTLSSLPDRLTADVINGYLDVKARHLM
ncbi:DUF58 domain-containing protein [bacterium]|nr:DUF58 domain-containing protein [bacterium]